MLKHKKTDGHQYVLRKCNLSTVNVKKLQTCTTSSNTTGPISKLHPGLQNKATAVEWH